MLNERVINDCQRVILNGKGDSLKWQLLVKIKWRLKKFSSFAHIRLILNIWFQLPNSKPKIDFDPPNSESFLLEFDGFTSASKSLQDMFAYKIGIDSGLFTYLEIGAGDAIQASNTYVLESFHGWRGVSVELDSDLAQKFSSLRANPIVEKNALSINYKELILEYKLGLDIGYLQIDIDPSYQSLACLLKIPFDKFRFAFITFEHDRYRTGNKVAKLQREILRYYGYELIVKDVLVDGKYPYEDWWVHPNLVSNIIMAKFIGSNINPTQHFG